MTLGWLHPLVNRPQRNPIVPSVGAQSVSTSTPTQRAGIKPDGPMKLPETGGTSAGWRLTAVAMWLAPLISPNVLSKPFQPAPGRYTSAQACVEPASADWAA